MKSKRLCLKKNRSKKCEAICPPGSLGGAPEWNRTIAHGVGGHCSIRWATGASFSALDIVPHEPGFVKGFWNFLFRNSSETAHFPPGCQEWPYAVRKSKKSVNYIEKIAQMYLQPHDNVIKYSLAKNADIPQPHIAYQNFTYRRIWNGKKKDLDGR